MGPEATILLMQKVLGAVPASDDGDHVPLIVHQNPQVPSRIDALITGTGADTGVDPGPVLVQMAHDLQAAGAQALAMPCNTAHHYAGTITRGCDLPFLDMLDLTAQAVAATGAQRIGIMASPAVRLTGVFDAAFAAQGLEGAFPQDDAPILSVIRAVKSGVGPDATVLTRAAQGLMDQGCDHILVACTELSLLTGALPSTLSWTDSLDCLCAAIVDFAKGNSKAIAVRS